jgi:hypothetical protein
MHQLSAHQELDLHHQGRVTKAELRSFVADFRRERAICFHEQEAVDDLDASPHSLAWLYNDTLFFSDIS